MSLNCSNTFLKMLLESEAEAQKGIYFRAGAYANVYIKTTLRVGHLYVEVPSYNKCIEIYSREYVTHRTCNLTGDKIVRGHVSLAVIAKQH